nr:MAG TPA: hypothetical protein [Caudoviricetes sp.]
MHVLGRNVVKTSITLRDHPANLTMGIGQSLQSDANLVFISHMHHTNAGLFIAEQRNNVGVQLGVKTDRCKHNALPFFKYHPGTTPGLVGVSYFVSLTMELYYCRTLGLCVKRCQIKSKIVNRCSACCIT